MSEEHVVFELERSALKRWCMGDPTGFLEISALEVTYFDPFLPQRLDGWDNLNSYYECLRGKVSVLHYEIINPQIQDLGDIAILTYNFVSQVNDKRKLRWNCSEVYRRTALGWKIIQTHWSLPQSS
ncbi:MAG: nuclear transport factor 2 family protein [Bdellovibrionales bacterium]